LALTGPYAKIAPSSAPRGFHGTSNQQFGDREDITLNREAIGKSRVPFVGLARPGSLVPLSATTDPALTGAVLGGSGVSAPVPYLLYTVYYRCVFITSSILGLIWAVIRVTS
jgi:hypothetical protein